MTDTIFVRGAGGGIVEMSVPRDGSVRREIFDNQLHKGQLIVVAHAEKVPTRRGYKWVEIRNGRQVEPEPITADLDDLRGKAADLDVKVDGRWGVERLQAEIAAAEAEAAPAAF